MSADVRGGGRTGFYVPRTFAGFDGFWHRFSFLGIDFFARF